MGVARACNAGERKMHNPRPCGRSHVRMLNSHFSSDNIALCMRYERSGHSWNCERSVPVSLRCTNNMLTQQYARSCTCISTGSRARARGPPRTPVRSCARLAVGQPQFVYIIRTAHSAVRHRGRADVIWGQMKWSRRCGGS